MSDILELVTLNGFMLGPDAILERCVHLLTLKMRMYIVEETPFPIDGLRSTGVTKHFSRENKRSGP